MSKKENGKDEIVVKAPCKKVVNRRRASSKLSNVKWFLKRMPQLAYDLFYVSLLRYFKNVNQRAGSKLAVWYMKCETWEHLDFLVKVFKWAILPATIFYGFSVFYFFGENPLDSILLGLAIFFYSNFLPDLPSIFRRKKADDAKKDIPWFKKYALLLLAPLFILAFICGLRLAWRTSETFHNFKSLLVYAVFISIFSFLMFGDFPISTGDITETIFVPLYAAIGYLTHLKTDLCF